MENQIKYSVMGRKKLGVSIDEDTWKLFKEWVKHKHGYERGILSKEVEIALRIHMNPDKSRLVDVDHLPARGGGIPDENILNTHTSADDSEYGKYLKLIQSFEERFDDVELIVETVLSSFIRNVENVATVRSVNEKIAYLISKNIIREMDLIDIKEDVRDVYEGKGRIFRNTNYSAKE
jgi:hypothetical protein